MAVPFFKVYYTDPNGVEYDITEVINLQDKRGLEVKSARSDIKIANSRWRDKSGGQSIFVEDGTIEIYADYSPITKASSQLLLTGQIQEIKPTLGEQGSQMALSCADKMSVVLGGLQGGTYTGQTSSQIIISIVAAATEDGEGNQAVTTSNVATLNKDGGAFPTIDTFARTFKPVVDIISELSGTGYTGDDRQYLFYVDKNNDLHWFYPAQTSSGTITEGTDEIYNVSMKRSIDEIVNMVIYNAGQDLYGNGVLWYYYDSSSRSNKLRMRYFPMIEIGSQLIDTEIASGNLTASSGGPFHYKSQDYDNGQSYNFGTSWGDTVTSDDDYNDSIRTEMKNQGNEKAAAITNRLGKLLWKGTIELKGTNSYVAGDLITVNLPTLGIVNQLLRVWDVQHSFGEDAWITNLELREDEQALAA